MTDLERIANVEAQLEDLDATIDRLQKQIESGAGDIDNTKHTLLAKQYLHLEYTKLLDVYKRRL